MITEKKMETENRKGYESDGKEKLLQKEKCLLDCEDFGR
jgi:hypothetical protein